MLQKHLVHYRRVVGSNRAPATKKFLPFNNLLQTPQPSELIISELLTWGAGNLSACWAFARGCDRVMHLQFRAGELGVSLVQVRAKRFEDSRSMRRTEWGQGDTKLLFRGFEISGIL